jgi:hypothetical protein
MKALGILIGLVFLAGRSPAMAGAATSAPPAPRMTNAFVTAPTSAMPVVTVDAFAHATTRPLGYVSYGTSNPANNTALLAFGREIAPDVWWFQ